MSTITGIEVELINKVDGNAFSIVGAVARAMARAKVDVAVIEAYKKECLSGDYNNLLVTTMRYVTITGGDDPYSEYDDEDEDGWIDDIEYEDED